MFRKLSRSFWVSGALLIASFVLTMVMAITLCGCAQVLARSHEVDLERLNAMGNVDHGETMQDFMNGVVNDEFETLGFFEQDGTKLYEYSDFDAESVAVTSQEVLQYFYGHYADLVMVHNHPNLPAFYDTSFSGTDLITFGAAPFLSESIVVTTHFVFHIQKEPGRIISEEESRKFFDELEFSFEDLLTAENYIAESGEITSPFSQIFAESYAEELNLSYWFELQEGVMPYWRVMPSSILGE